MEKMFSQMMKGFMADVSAEDKEKMMAGMMSCCEKMAGAFPCVASGGNSEEGRKAMMEKMEKMMSLCGGMMQARQACFKTAAQPGDEPDRQSGI